MAVLLGLAWREFAGAPLASVLFLLLTVALYGAAIAFVALSGSADIHVCRPVPNASSGGNFSFSSSGGVGSSSSGVWILSATPI